MPQLEEADVVASLRLEGNKVTMGLPNKDTILLGRRRVYPLNWLRKLPILIRGKARRLLSRVMSKMSPLAMSPILISFSKIKR